MSTSNSSHAKIDVHNHFIPPTRREGQSRTSSQKSPDETSLTSSFQPLPQREATPQAGRPSNGAPTHAGKSCPKSTPRPQSSPSHRPVPKFSQIKKAAAHLVRKINEYAAQLRDKEPHQFGFFATLPSLLDTEAALTEIRYALDELQADGVCLYTRYGPGRGQLYPGHAHFDPI
jgi:6-methylsalicylate decarboxylase